MHSPAPSAARPLRKRSVPPREDRPQDDGGTINSHGRPKSSRHPARREGNLVGAEAITQLRPRLQAFARRALHDDADAEDVTQDTLLAMLRAPAPFRGEAALPTYATAILRHKIADLVRARIAERRARATVAIEALCHVDAAPDPCTSLAGCRRRERFWPHLRAQLRALPALTRETFVMRLLYDCSVEEASERLRISRNHISVLTTRAKTHLRGTLDPATLQV